jgi:hypothetical protein
MGIHSKCIKFFLLPTVLLFVMRFLYFLDISQTFCIILSSDSGMWRLGLFIIEVIFYISLYCYIRYQAKSISFRNTVDNSEAIGEEIINIIKSGECNIEFTTTKYGFRVTRYSKNTDLDNYINSVREHYKNK